jgi:hypothetical protein
LKASGTPFDVFAGADGTVAIGSSALSTSYIGVVNGASSIANFQNTGGNADATVSSGTGMPTRVQSTGGPIREASLSTALAAKPVMLR